jgi:hypothetical protein
VIAKGRIPVECETLFKAHYKATIRPHRLLFANESAPATGIDAAKRPDNKDASPSYENGRAMPGRQSRENPWNVVETLLRRRRQRNRIVGEGA